MVQAVIYARVSTQDQDCARQVDDLKAFALRAGYKVVGVYTEKASGTKNDRIERNKVLKLAQARKIDAILVTEMSRWGRSTADLIGTLKQLESFSVSLIAMSGMTFDLSTPQGKMITTMLAAFSEFERDLIAERTKSGIAAAHARGKKSGRTAGFNPSDKHSSEVIKLIREGVSYREIARRLNLSKTTIVAIQRRNSAELTAGCEQ